MSTPELTQQIIERSKSVAGNADFLSMAMVNQNQGQIEAALDDLLVAYDQYADRATSHPVRLSFDGALGLTPPDERDQGAANTLASALVDLEMAVLMGHAAQVAGELDGDTGASDLDQSVASLSETLDAIQGTVPGNVGTGRLAFDAGNAAPLAELQASPDQLTAKNNFTSKAQAAYAKLVSESTAMLVDMIKELSGLDENQIKQGLDTIKTGLDVTPAGKALPRMLDALQRAIQTLKDLVGEEGFKKIDENVSTMVAEIKKGEGALQAFLVFSYQSEDSQKKIQALVDASLSGIATLDNGSMRLDNLQQQVVQTFAVSRKIVSTLRALSAPIKWLLMKFGGTAPVDVLLGGLYFMIADVALLRGMDYADTTTLVRLVDGIPSISAQTLGKTN